MDCISGNNCKLSGLVDTRNILLNEPVRLLRVLDPNESPYPIILRDDYTNQLGWT